MKSTLKHVVVHNDEGKRSLVAVSFTECDGRLKVETLAGPPPYIDALVSILDAAMPGWEAEAERLHLTRKRPWHVKYLPGMSGCVDYKLYTLRNEYLADWPLRACLHVSMYEKLNEDLCCWLGDLPPLLAEAAKTKRLFSDDTSARAYDPQPPRNYTFPGEESGLLDVLKRRIYPFTPAQFIERDDVKPYEHPQGSGVLWVRSKDHPLSEDQLWAISDKAHFADSLLEHNILVAPDPNSDDTGDWWNQKREETALLSIWDGYRDSPMLPPVERLILATA